MIFEKGWFLHKMNKHAPKGYKFMAVGNEGRIAMYSKEIMGQQTPRGPFVSCFSFDLLDTVYGGLMTKRYDKINQANAPIEYLMAYQTVKLPTFAQSQEIADQQAAQYEIYRTIVHQHIHILQKPAPILIRKNAIFVQGLQDINKPLPGFLADRLQKYVNKSVWYAIEKVLASMPICDMKYYQQQYHNKTQELGIEYGKKLKIVDVDRIAFEKRYDDLVIKIENLTYDVLPRQEKSLARAMEKEQTPEKLNTLQKQVDATKVKIAKMVAERDSLAPQDIEQPAREMLPGLFFDKKQPVIPKIASSEVGQLLQLMLTQEVNKKTK